MTDNELRELEDRVANALDVPEPSPLFWEHFPGRVRAAIGASAETRAPWWKRPAVALAFSLALAAGLSSWAYWRVSDRGTPAVVDTRVLVDAPESVPYVEDETEDEGWQVVTSVAASAGAETLREAGFGVAPGGAEAAIDDMSESERAQLVALLRAEMSGDAGGL